MVTDETIIGRIAERLLPLPPGVDAHGDLIPDWTPAVPFDRPPVLAAVLIALVERSEGLTVLYTERSADLRAHSGQVAFPGGKVDPDDAHAGASALREAAEEVALVAEDARILGYMPTYFTGTNYLITPVVAVVRPSAPFVANLDEVQSLFEVPLAHILDLASYGTFRVKRNGIEHRTLQIDHQGHRIWGITAHLTRRFRDLVVLEAGR